MSENKRNILVGIFVLAGLAALGWLIVRFGDLPTLVSRYDAHEVLIYFPEAPGIQENTSVFFCGYPVGKVLKVNPPALLSDLDDPEKEYYQIVVEIAVSTDYQVPKNVVPKVFRRGLGVGYVEFVLEDETPSNQLLSQGDTFKGRISEASEFISEKTQAKLDELIGSLADLSKILKGQLTPTPPEAVDDSTREQKISANITTAIMRLDDVLKNLNDIVGDVENKNNIKKGLAEFTQLVTDMQQTVKDAQVLAGDARGLIAKSSDTVGHVDKVAMDLNATFQQTGERIQNAADAMAQSMQSMNKVLLQISEGDGTMGRVLNDPRLYESFVDACQNLNLAITDFRELIAKVKEEGFF
jgi:phospholipid/cholesterol/gamma-HCH transport system substrate-binding protein